MGTYRYSENLIFQGEDEILVKIDLLNATDGNSLITIPNGKTFRLDESGSVSIGQVKNLTQKPVLITSKIFNLADEAENLEEKIYINDRLVVSHSNSISDGNSSDIVFKCYFQVG